MCITTRIIKNGDYPLPIFLYVIFISYNAVNPELTASQFHRVINRYF